MSPEMTQTEIVDVRPKRTVPPECAVIETMGWDETTPGKFTVTLWFPNGQPRIPLRFVWDGVPLQLVPVGEET